MVVFFIFPIIANAQIDTELLYSEAMEAYNNGNYKVSSDKFQLIIKENNWNDLSSTVLYNGACVFSLNKDEKLALEILTYLANSRYYSNLGHITTDSDLNNIHNYPDWGSLVEKAKKNVKTLPERTQEKVKSELCKAKEILLSDNGKLWGESIWSDDILVLGFDNTIYSLTPLENSKTKDSIVFYKKIPSNTLGFSNAAQQYNGKEYAVVLTNYLNDNSATIIHELFHVLQHKHINLNGNPISYLENYDARLWLRLEYQALKNALSLIDKNAKANAIKKYINDALLFRKLRQSKYNDLLKSEIEIETSEGLANYTGFLLSTYPNKYQKTIREINQREQAETYTRSFPYATGPAYGLIFDYLEIEWKQGLDKTYNFLDIYETQYLKKKIETTNSGIESSRKRNNYIEIQKQEIERKNKQDKLIEYYTDKLITSPTLKVTSIGGSYNRTFNMNGTLALDSARIIFSGIKGSATSADDFGNFMILSGKDKLGVAGVMLTWIDEKMTFVFPLPFKVEGNRIIGEFYEIELNQGWEVKKLNTKGDLEIVKIKD